jgi:hypothetical protein
MFVSSVSSCKNEKCSKKDNCLRYNGKDNTIASETYLVLTEEQCEKSKSYINKDEYYKTMILNAINENPKDELDRKYLLELCNSLLAFANKYGLEKELKEKIKLLENN